MQPWYAGKGTRMLIGAGLSVLLIGGARGEEAVKAELETPAGEIVPELLALADWPLDPERDEPAAGVPAGEEEGASREVKTAYAAGAEELAGALADAEPFARLAAVDAGELDEIRGGFEPADSSLRLSFGIERVVYINGQLVASTVLRINDLQAVAGTGGVPAALPDVGGALHVIQNGAGNGFAVQVGANAAASVIQNTLDGQAIATVTTVSAAVNSLQVMRTLNLQSAIRDGVVDSLRR